VNQELVPQNVTPKQVAFSPNHAEVTGPHTTMSASTSICWRQSGSGACSDKTVQAAAGLNNPSPAPVGLNMKNLRHLLVFALLLSPATAAAQVVHINEDPNPRTDRCQNQAAAFHADGDVVRVDYHGEWRDRPKFGPVQNGSPHNNACATDAIARVDADQNIVWQRAPADLGFDRIDKVTEMKAAGGGKTLMSIREGVLDDDLHSTVMLLDADGDVEWRFRSEQAPKFSIAEVRLGDGGEVFVRYGFTNYGYEGGRLQLPGGRVWKLGVNQYKSVVARIDPAKGEVIWEREGGTIVSARGGELLTRSVRRTRSDSRTRTRHRFDRLTYDGERTSKAYTSWMTSEPTLSVERIGDEIWMTNEVEIIESSNGRVQERRGRLRVFDLSARELHKRTLSDGAQLAAATRSATKSTPVRIVSPSECTRGVLDGYGCVADALDVLTLSSWKDDGTTTRIRVRSHQFEHRRFEAASTAKGLWVSATTRYRHNSNPAPAVVTMYSPDASRAKHKRDDLFVWKPDKRLVEKSSAKPKLGF
jgi:hypothetical protein